MVAMRRLRRLFRRRTRLDLGRFIAPPPVAPAPVERIVADGTLIADSVVRMVVRNRIIVDVLRDRRDLDLGVLLEAASLEFERLADHEWESAERIRLRRDVTGTHHADDDELAESRRREEIHREMSAAFAARAEEDDRVMAIVEQSRAEAWADIAAVLLEHAGSRAFALDRDPGYDAERSERVAAMLALDLTRLAQESGVDL